MKWVFFHEGFSSNWKFQHCIFSIVEKGIFVFRHGRDVPLLLHTGAPSVSLDRFVWTENVTRLMPLHGG